MGQPLSESGDKPASKSSSSQPRAEGGNARPRRAKPRPAAETPGEDGKVGLEESRREKSPPAADVTGRSSSSPPAPRPTPSASGQGPTSTRNVVVRSTNPLPRYGFYLFWIVGLPLAFAVFTVWIATRNPDGAGVLPAIISDQKIPAGILFFTAFAIILWRFRHDLPLSAAAGVGGRRDVPAKLRGRYEEAGILLEEARRILRTKKKDIERELTSTEREDLTKGLDDLENAMNVEPFASALFEKAHSRAERLVGEHLSRWRKGEIREYAESIAIAVGVALLLRVFVIEAFKIPSGSMIPTLMVGDHIFVNKFRYGPLLPFTDKRLFSNLPPDRADVIVFKYPQNPEQDFIKRVIATPGDRLEVVDGRPIINGWVVPHCHVGTFLQDDGTEAQLYLEYLNDRSYFTLHKNPPRDVSCNADRDCTSDEERLEELGLLERNKDHDAASIKAAVEAFQSKYGLPATGKLDPATQEKLAEKGGDNYSERCYSGICGRDHKEYQAKPEEVWVLGDNRDNSHDSRAWNEGRGGGVPFDNIKGRAMVVFITFGPSQSVLERLLVDVMGRPRLPKNNAHLQPALDKCMREKPERTSPPDP